MKKKLAIVLLMITLVFSSLYLYQNKSQGSNHPMIVSVTKNQVVISLHRLGVSGHAYVYAYHANDYYPTDTIRGISSSVKSQGTFIGRYRCGTNKTFTIERYTNGYDALYYKYYVIYENTILYGPVYATDILSENQDVHFKQSTIKGMFADADRENEFKYADDLNVKSITINIAISELIYSNEPVNGKTMMIPNDAISMKVNGKMYYFHKDAVSEYDKYVQEASKRHMNVIAIIAAWKSGGYYTTYPDALKYDSPVSNTLMGTNTANDLGREYLIATMEFLAKRYSQSAEKGYISHYVISNEIDSTYYFYNCNDLNTYMEEYKRTLRLSNLAVKKYAVNAQVVVPFTHMWNAAQNEVDAAAYGYCLKPKEMLDWLAHYTNARGAYDWAIAPHLYSAINTKSNYAGSDVETGNLSGDYKTSKIITFSNLEVLGEYLEQNSLKYKGQMRSVYLTEGGPSSGSNTKESQNQQAASVAQAYYKASQLSFIKSFNFYRLKDHQDETKVGLSCGLLDENNQPKPVYDVYKYIDTPATYDHSDPYLTYIHYKRDGQKEISVAAGTLHSWQDAMWVYTSSYNWQKDYKKSAPYMSH